MQKDLSQTKKENTNKISKFKELNKWRDTVPEYIKDYVPLNK